MHRRAYVFAILLVLFSGDPSRQTDDHSSEKQRLDELVEANAKATHAFQILLARQSGLGDPRCYPRESPPADFLRSLDAHQQALLQTPPEELRQWIAGKHTKFDPSRDLEPLLHAQLAMPENLPVNAVAAHLGRLAPAASRASVRAVASLYQMDLEMERDGDRLQDLIGFYIAAGLPVYVGQLGLPGSDEDFLVSGRALDGQACVSPFGLSAEDWQIAGRKIWNWGEKRLHIRDAGVLARELLKEPDVSASIPAMKRLPAQKVAVIGHSFTMDVHWASPSAFVPVVTAMFAQTNPGVVFRQFAGGGLTFSRAYRNFYREALDWKPDTVLFVLAGRTEEDLADLRIMAEGFRRTGARVVMFDSVYPAVESDPPIWRQITAASRDAGVEILPVQKLLAASAKRDQFVCLDHIHMKEPYHRLMAKEWLKAILRAKSAPAASPGRAAS